ncbi:MAG: FkbM family methyltransferase [Gammaproteobacteria bacterium]|nr:FkbM family methyltransferase [Gammaproteobacteria bacterium]
MTSPDTPADFSAINIADDVVVSVPDSLQYMTTYILREQEDWFEDEIQFLRRYARPGMRVLDIGANYGLYSLSLAKKIGAGGKVWAVEPCTATAQHLNNSIALNGFTHIELLQTALSDRTGRAQLTVENNSELNALANDPGTNNTEEVALTTLDRLAQQHNIHTIDFLKIDAEGEEQRILQAGETFLRGENPLIMFEIRQGNTFNFELATRFKSLGYDSYRLIPGLNALVPFDTPATAGNNYAPDNYLLNLFCCKPERAQQLAKAGLLVMEPSEKASDTDDGWRDELSNLPFAQTWRRQWSKNAPELQHGQYRTALAHYWASRQTRHDLPRRFAHLREAFRLLSSACDQNADLYQVSTLARVTSELGERQLAVNILINAINTLRQSAPGDAGQPFLPASRFFDDIAPSETPQQWLFASLLDQNARLATYSTYFMSADFLQPLNALRDTGFERPEMARRRQLVSIRAQLQHGPEAEPMLAETRPDNLNPNYWQNAANY